MKLFLLSLVFLFLMGCGSSQSDGPIMLPNIPDAPDAPDDRDYSIDFNEIKSIYFQAYYYVDFEYLDDKINKTEQHVNVYATYYCLNPVESYPAYNYSSNEIHDQITAYVYADRNKKTLLRKIKGKLPTPDKEEYRTIGDTTFEFEIRIPYNKEKYMYIEMKNEKRELLGTKIHPYVRPEMIKKLDVINEETLNSMKETTGLFKEKIQCYEMGFTYL